ncbi:MAG: hypothetical protein JNK57_11350 [Planctomycetaceae bacterium]|nr:hypothetical protein [Planctomycetaceae bacterium]
MTVLLCGFGITSRCDSWNWLDIVFGCMNNLAYVVGMKPVLKFSYYVGTFGEYDLKVIART